MYNNRSLICRKGTRNPLVIGCLLTKRDSSTIAIGSKPVAHNQNLDCPTSPSWRDVEIRKVPLRGLYPDFGPNGAGPPSLEFIAPHRKDAGLAGRDKTVLCAFTRAATTAGWSRNKNLRLSVNMSARSIGVWRDGRRA